jgi:hypothetical protein
MQQILQDSPFIRIEVTKYTITDVQSSLAVIMAESVIKNVTKVNLKRISRPLLKTPAEKNERQD